MLRAALLVAIAFASIPRGLAEPPAKPAPPPQKVSLKITSLDPTQGDVEGGSYVVLKGERFIKDGPRAAKVYFGANQGSVVRFVSDTELIVQSPPGKANEVVDVRVVFEPGGELTLPKAFTYAKPKPSTGPSLKITSISPDKGDMDGGTYVVLKGERFIKDGPRNAKVYFGSRQGTVVRFQSDGELIVQAPGGKKNEVVDVLVMFDPGGQIKLPKAFTFVDKGNGPTIDDLPKK